MLDAVGVEAATGLSDEQARRLLASHGPNEFQRTGDRSFWRVLIDQFRSLVTLLLLAAAGVSYAFGDYVEAAAIAVLILVNTVVGLVMEWRAMQSMAALRALGGLTATVRRGGRTRVIPAADVVPGDILHVEAGDLMSADARLVDASRLRADESLLTGESLPVDKQVDAVDSGAALHDRTNLLFKGTTIRQGSASAVVVATGADTELGRIATLVQEAGSEATPLEKRLERLGRRLIVATLLVAGAVAVAGVLRGGDVRLMVETGIALAVAAVPEGLPVVATLALARGMLQMARRNALVRRLAAVETLGSTGVICVDKTGTVTENRMVVARLVTADGEIELVHEPGGVGAFRRDGQPLEPREDAALWAALEVGALCSNASLSPDGEHAGDPMEVALLEAARMAGLGRPELLATQPEVGEEAFDPGTRMMATFHEGPEGRTAVKGAPEAILEVCTRAQTGAGQEPLDDSDRARWLAHNDRLAAQGLRVLALAQKAGRQGAPYQGLDLLALVALHDPPRADVAPALAACRRAGIRVVMVTGDQPGTARAIAYAVGLVDSPDVPVVMGSQLKRPEDMDDVERAAVLGAQVFSRVSPEQKLDIIALHQEAGHVVAMTGDGVNDAPALQKADIGVAMGGRGTQVAREAADLVLKDDAFPTIVAAVRGGRAIFTNIRRFTFYLMSCNAGEVAVVGAAALLGSSLPLLPLHILYLNLVTDVFPALALGFGRGDPEEMERPPRPASEPFLTRAHWWGIAAYGGLFTAATLGAFLLADSWLGLDPVGRVTVSFATIAFAQLWHVLNMRDAHSTLLRNDIVSNRYVAAALVLSTALILVAIYLPALAQVLQLRPLGAAAWGLVAAFSLVPVVVGQAILFVRRARTGTHPAKPSEPGASLL